MELILLFFVSMLSGFALMSVEPVSFLSFLGPVLDIVGALVVIVFALALSYKGVKSIFK